MPQDPVTITDRAAVRINELTGEGVLRIGLRKGGCAGMEYTMDVLARAEDGDIVVERDGARIALAPLSQMFLLGMRIDYRSSLLESGFHFDNPNVSGACGCGESVSFSLEEMTARRGS